MWKGCSGSGRSTLKNLLMEKAREREGWTKQKLSSRRCNKLCAEEVRAAMNRMKTGKAVGPDDIPVEAWRCLGELAIDFLTRLFNKILEDERMLDEWRSVLVPIFKNKGDVQLQ